MLTDQNKLLWLLSLVLSFGLIVVLIRLEVFQLLDVDANPINPAHWVAVYGTFVASVLFSRGLLSLALLVNAKRGTVAVKAGAVVFLILTILCFGVLYWSFHRKYVSPKDMISFKIEGVDLIPQNAICKVLLERTNGQVEFAEPYVRKVVYALIDGRSQAIRKPHLEHPLKIRFVPDNKRYGILVQREDDHHSVFWFTEPFTRDDIRRDVVIDLRAATMDESDARVELLLDSIRK